MTLAIYKFLVTRQLAGYSGDLYINVDSEGEFHALYDGIMDRSINEVNGTAPIADIEGIKVKFQVIDKVINKTFDVHIRKNASDGLRLTLTSYIKHMSTTPSQVLVVYLDIQNTQCKFYVKSECHYKYILEKHRTSDRYRIIMDEVPDEYPNIERITVNANAYLAHFNIISTGDRTLKWQSTYFNSYRTDGYTQKYIGVPYTTEHGLTCDTFEKIEEIL